MDYMADATVDYASGARCGLRCCASVDYASLWISQPFGLGRIYPHAGAPCGLRERGSQWITMLRICGLVECGGWLRPHAPQAGLSSARFASCGCSSGAHGVSSAFGRMGYFSCLRRGASAGFGVSPSFVGRAFVEACPLMPQEREALRERCRVTPHPAAPLIGMRLCRAC